MRVAIKRKLKEWTKQYLPSEIIGTVTAVGAASLMHVFNENQVVVAYAGSVGEALGFYTTVFIQSVITADNQQKLQNKRFSLAGVPKILAKLLLEFGPAGLVDGLILRPLFMYLFPIYLNNVPLGILVGKIAGDFTFYGLVILSYELNKKNKNAS